MSIKQQRQKIFLALVLGLSGGTTQCAELTASPQEMRGTNPHKIHAPHIITKKIETSETLLIETNVNSVKKLPAPQVKQTTQEIAQLEDREQNLNTSSKPKKTHHERSNQTDLEKALTTFYVELEQKTPTQKHTKHISFSEEIQIIPELEQSQAQQNTQTNPQQIPCKTPTKQILHTTEANTQTSEHKQNFTTQNSPLLPPTHTNITANHTQTKLKSQTPCTKRQAQLQHKTHLTTPADQIKQLLQTQQQKHEYEYRLKILHKISPQKSQHRIASKKTKLNSQTSRRAHAT